MWHIFVMPAKIESPLEVEQWFHAQVAGLWPAALGSLSLRKTRCVRAHCEACARGDQHPSHILYCRIKGRRVGLYIPEALVPQIQQSLDNGRALQELLFQAAHRYTAAVKHQRAAAR